MMRRTFVLQDVVSFPQPLTEGVLYVSNRFAASAHKCACGCGNDVILALNSAQWQLGRHDDGSVSLSPSIDNSSFPCRSHYWIRRGKVDWYAKLTKEEAVAARERDLKARTNYYRELNRSRGLFGDLWSWIKSLFSMRN